MSLMEQSCREFAELLASKEPTPGGGGASALAGALGIALGNMVGSLTKGKKKYAAVEQEMEHLMKQAEALRREFLELIQRDAESFAPLAAAYGMPTGTEQEQQEKALVMEAALKDACVVPMKIMENCCRAIEICRTFAEKGSKLAISDAAAGATLCGAALEAASLNVYINTKSMKDRQYAERLNQSADEMRKTYGALAEQVKDSVIGTLK